MGPDPLVFHDSRIRERVHGPWYFITAGLGKIIVVLVHHNSKTREWCLMKERLGTEIICLGAS